MTPNELRESVAKLPGVTEEVLWSDNLVFKVGGRMFLITGLEGPRRFSLPVASANFLALTEVPGIIPAPYLAKAGWIQVHPRECALSKPELRTMVAQAYALIVAKLSKKAQRELGMLP